MSRLRLEPKKCFTVAGLIVAVHGVMLASVVSATVHWALQAVVSVCVLYSATHYACLHGFRCLARSVREIQVADLGGVEVIRESGMKTTTVIAPGSFCNAWFVILRLEESEGHVFLTPSMVGDGPYRRLCALLRINA